MSRVLKFSAVVVLLLLVLVNLNAARPSKRRTRVTLESGKFNSTQLIKQVREMSKNSQKFRRLATLSLLTGAIKTEERMEMELTKLMNDFVDTFNDTSLTGKEKKVKEISRFVQRDLRAMFILSSAIDLTHYNASFEEFRNSMREFALAGEQMAPKLDKHVLRNDNHPVTTIRNFVDEHIRILRNALMNRVSDSIAAMKSEDEINGTSLKIRPILIQSEENVEDNTIPLPKINSGAEKEEEDSKTGKDKKPAKKSVANSPVGPFDSPAEVTSVYYQSYQDEILQHLQMLDRRRRGSDDDDLDFDTNDDRPGGLVGLIGSLSGGEEGSDVAAVIGALSGVVGQIFGPGGVDVNALLSTGTSLIAGLLGGDQNFGKVLATYVGTSLDGLSGGGGADLNGLFIGNILGGVLGALSADPEDEDVNPIKPGIFLNHVLMGSFQGLAKAPEEGESRKDSGSRKSSKDRQMEGEDGEGGHPHGSDVFGFIKGMIKAVVGGVVSIVVNSLSGLSHGALKGGMQLSMGTSGPLSDASDGFAAMVTT